MQLKISATRTLLTCVLIGCSLYVAFLFYFIPKDIIQSDSALLIENAVALSNQEQIITGLPIRFKIPKINIDSLVEYVGLTSGGAMDVPKNREDVAWFELGPRPGEDGTAIIAGHYGIKNRKESVFDNLHKLRKGDKVYIEDDKGILISFVVRESRRYDPKADATDVFGVNTGPSHLNLVTCEGEWDEILKDYPTRLVIFTDKE